MAEKHTDMNVFQAVNAVMNDVKAVGKEGFNKHQQFNFRGIDGVMNAVGPALRNHGVIAVPMVEEAHYGTVQTNRGGTMSTVNVKMRVRWYGPAGDYFDSVTYGESFDSGDKATAKAHSVAFRTAILQTLCLPTQESDPDEHTYERASQQQIMEQQRQQQMQQRKAWLAEQAQKLMDAEKEGNADSISRVKDWAVERGDGELATMARQTLERMEAAGLVQDELGGEVVQGELIDA